MQIAMNDNKNAALLDIFMLLWSKSTIMVLDKLSSNTIALQVLPATCSLVEFARFKAVCGDRLVIADWQEDRIECILTSKPIADMFTSNSATMEN